MNKNFIIRNIKPIEYPILSDFLYYAIFSPPGTNPLPREVIKNPELAVYINNFGSLLGDIAVVAILGEKIVGAAWTRIIPGFGHIDNKTPELAISVLPEYRGQKIGTKLMEYIFKALKNKGFTKTSLSIQKINPAFRLYKRMGYKIAIENDEDFIMVRDLK